jgi:trigger factor
VYNKAPITQAQKSIHHKDIKLELQVEHLENHTAQLIVKVDDEKLEKAMRNAAKRLSKELRIPGFRPGKAPYNVVLNLVGKDGLTNEALEDVGNDIYKDALEESGIEPYASGEITDVNTDEGLTLTFVVPKRPEVELGDYREIRIDFEEPEVTDKDVENGLERTRESLALSEKVDRAAQMDDRAVLDIKGVFATADAKAEVEEAAAEENDETEADDIDDEEETNNEEEFFVNSRRFDFILTADSTRDLIVGFSQEIVGASVGDELHFSLTFPDDEEDEDLAGRTVDFEVTVSEVQALTLPEVDDFMAELASDGEIKTLDELRDKMREQLVETLEQQADEAYGEKVLSQIAETATITYPDAVLNDYIDDILGELDQNLRQRMGLGLDDYIKVTGNSREALREENRERATERLRKTLVLTELAQTEELTTNDEELDAEVEKQAQNFGDQSDVFRDFLNSEYYRSQLASNLVTQRTVRRLIDIAKGKNPEKGIEREDDGDDTDSNDESDSQEVVAEITDSAENVVEENAEAAVETTDEDTSESED